MIHYYDWFVTIIILNITWLVSGEKPSPRWANACGFIDATIYCYGGETDHGIASNDMYSLDLYKSWDAMEAPWIHDAAGSASGPATAFYASATLPGHPWLLVNGGEMGNTYQTMLYNTNQHQWQVPLMRGVPGIQRKQHTASSDNEGRIWIWGGMSDANTYGGLPMYHNTWTVIDTNTWLYSYPIVHDPPPPRVDHTATIMPSGHILIIGGVVFTRNVTDPQGMQTLNPISMNSILLFDTAAGQWSNITAGGNIPAPRRGHSAVLSWDQSRIIVFGGCTPDETMTLNDVFILEVKTMRWTAPSIDGVPPKPRTYHQALLIDDLMLIMFGRGSNKQGYNDVGVLSTSTWSWKSRYTSNPAWLSGNLSASHGVVKNSTGTYGGDTRSNSRDPDSAPSFPVFKQDNTTLSNTTSETPHEHRGRITAGIIAGVISGGVVVIGGGVFLFVTVIIYRRGNPHRKKGDARAASSSSSSSSITDEEGGSGDTVVVLSPLSCSYQQKPDQEDVDLAPQTDPSQYHKPDDIQRTSSL